MFQAIVNNSNIQVDLPFFIVVVELVGMSAVECSACVVDSSSKDKFKKKQSKY